MHKLLQIANGVEPVLNGRIHIELINAPFVYEIKGTPAPYKAALDLAIARGVLWRHEVGTYMKFTSAGAEMFA